MHEIDFFQSSEYSLWQICNTERAFQWDHNILWAKARLNASEDEIVEECNLENNKGTVDGSMLCEFG